MSGRQLSLKEMGIIKRNDSIINSKIKRREYIPDHNIVKEQHVVCGCGSEGCIFVSLTKKDETNSK
jgi:hypothetical protein